MRKAFRVIIPATEGARIREHGECHSAKVNKTAHSKQLIALRSNFPIKKPAFSSSDNDNFADAVDKINLFSSQNKVPLEGLLEAVHDSPAMQVIRTQLHPDSVPYDTPHKILPNTTTNMGEYYNIVS